MLVSCWRVGPFVSILARFSVQKWSSLRWSSWFWEPHTICMNHMITRRICFYLNAFRPPSIVTKRIIRTCNNTFSKHYSRSRRFSLCLRIKLPQMAMWDAKIRDKSHSFCFVFHSYLYFCVASRRITVVIALWQFIYMYMAIAKLKPKS